MALNWLFPYPILPPSLRGPKGHSSPLVCTLVGKSDLTTWGAYANSGPHNTCLPRPEAPRHVSSDRSRARNGARGRDTPISILVTSTLHPTHAPPSHAQENNPRNSHSLATTPWFTITGTHMFITSGTSTVMTQHHLHHVDGSTPTAPHCL